MRKVGFFIGFLIEAETQQDSQVTKIDQLFKEYEKRSSRLSYTLCIAGIVGGAILGTLLSVAFHLLGH